MSHKTSFAFLRAKSIASKRPIPLPAPVMRQISPSTDLYLAGKIHLQNLRNKVLKIMLFRIP